MLVKVDEKEVVHFVFQYSFHSLGKSPCLRSRLKLGQWFPNVSLFMY